MIDIRLYYNTIRYLRKEQVIFQAYNKVRKYFGWSNNIRPASSPPGQDIILVPAIVKPTCLFKDGYFNFLNQQGQFTGDWSDKDKGALWTYNLNYMDYLLQSSIDRRTAKQWIFRFIEDWPANKCARDPYPIALRGINWIKFIAYNKDSFTGEEKRAFDASLYIQYAVLARNLERHLQGNHLLEDGYSLLWGAIYFKDKYLYKRACDILLKELKEQILNDGAHFELSPMYHSILTDRLLDCINISQNNPVFENQKELDHFLIQKAQKMLGWLEIIVYTDKTIPLLNDSAYGVAPSYVEIAAYAGRLGIEWSKGQLGHCGYRKYRNDRYECIVDVGQIGASYIPGHAHADTFNFELRVDCRPFIVDTGISTYNKNERRQYERSTAAHNTITIGGKDSSRVWGGFRCAERAEVKIHADNLSNIKASHDGYKGLTVFRSFEFRDFGLQIEDSIPINTVAVGRLHLAPDIRIISIDNNAIQTSLGAILIENTEKLWIEECSVSQQYNTLCPAYCICYRFSGTTTIHINVE